MRYRAFTTAGGWAAQVSGPAGHDGDPVMMLNLSSDPLSDKLGLLFVDDNSDLQFSEWNDAFGVVTEIETSVYTESRECFTLAYPNVSGDALRIVSAITATSWQ